MVLLVGIVSLPSSCKISHRPFLGSSDHFSWRGISWELGFDWWRVLPWSPEDLGGTR